MAMKIGTVLACTTATCLFSTLTFAQKAGVPCPLVIARTPQEALQIEQSSNKKGCWARDKNGHLVFLSTGSPKDYKPLVEGDPRPPKDLPAPGVTSIATVPGKQDPIIGKWHIDCCKTINATGFASFHNRLADGTEDGVSGTLEIDAGHRPHWTCERETHVYKSYDRNFVDHFRSETKQCSEKAQWHYENPWIGTLTVAAPGKYTYEHLFDSDGKQVKLQLIVTGDEMRGQVYDVWGDGPSSSTYSFTGSRLPVGLR